MTPREKFFFEYLQKQQKAFEDLYSLGYTFLEPNDVWAILIEEYGVEVNTDVFCLVLSAEDMVKVVDDVLKRKGTYRGRIEFTINSEDVNWLSVDNSEISKAIIKEGNAQWTIHQNDVDSFPSIPHAHNYANGLVLSLKTGELFRKRQPAGKISQKELARIREKIQRKLPSLKLPDLE